MMKERRKEVKAESRREAAMQKEYGGITERLRTVKGHLT
jgi:hypothetical protein